MNIENQNKPHKILSAIIWLIIIISAVYFRTSGLYRGLESNYIYHPDEPKQVVALGNFLQDIYVWHVGNLFYDGYPLALNHLDELILRPVLKLKRAINKHIYAKTLLRESLDIGSLYYWARGLRVFYGMLCLFLAYFITKKIIPSFASAYLVGFIMAIAPLSITVSHFATGDIGVDLFTAVMLLLLCIYAKKKHYIYLFGAGLFSGVAFACKYNGLLGSIVIGLYVLLNTIFIKEKIKKLIIDTVNASGGFIVGAVIATPAFFINFHQTWRNMWANFIFIKNYDVGKKFLSKPLLERLYISFTNNVPLIFNSIGWIIILLAFIGVIIAGCQLFRKRSEFNLKKCDYNVKILQFSIFLYPFVAFLISFASKPSVQPFHFSYLQIPLTISAVYSIIYMFSMKKCLIKMIALILIVSLFSELSIKTEKDNFFWQREDNIYFVHNFIEHVFTRQPDQSSSGSIKTVSLEADNSAVFRNRRRKILSFSSDFWNNIHIVPVPSIPYPLNHNWIFANGPVFPRNDRVFKLLGKSSISKDIVLYDKPESITLGIRSGSLPVSMDIELGAVHKKITLYPNEDDLTVIIPAKWREIKSKKQLGYNIFILPLNIKSLLGNAWISVLKDKREVAYFKLFSGSINKISEYNLQKYLFITPEEKIVKEMKHTRFIEGYKETKIVSDVYYKDFSAILLSKESIPLPCGVYIFEGDIIGLSNTSKISFQIGEAKGYFNALSQSKKIISIDRGEQKIKFSFSKTFAPYECNILISPIIGKCRLKKWKITPDTVQVLSDLKKWKIHGDKPLWLKKYPYAQKEDLSTIQENILFDNKIELKYFYFPSSLKNGAKYDVYCGMDLKDFNMRRFDEYYVFLHFMDKNHKQIYAGQLPLWQAVEAYRSRIPITCKPVNGLPKGEYEIKMGIWHARTDKRLPVSCNRITKKERRRRRIFVSKTTVLE